MVGKELPYIDQWARDHELLKRKPYEWMYTWDHSIWATLWEEDIIYRPSQGGITWAKDEEHLEQVHQSCDLCGKRTRDVEIFKFEHVT